jgi:hypothetical protein
VFGRDMPGVACRQYTDGGGQNGPCINDPLDPVSALVESQGPARCTFYDDFECGLAATGVGPTEPGRNECTWNKPRMLNYFSFNCEVSRVLLFHYYDGTWN